MLLQPAGTVPPAYKDPVARRAYMAVSRVDKAMLKGHAMDGLGPDHLQMAPNPCGLVMALELDGNYTATAAEVRGAASKASQQQQVPLQRKGIQAMPCCRACMPCVQHCLSKSCKEGSSPLIFAMYAP